MRMRLAFTAFLSIITGPVFGQEQHWDRWFVGFDAGFIGRHTLSATEGPSSYSGFSGGLSAGKWWQIENIALGFELAGTFGGAANRWRISQPWAEWAIDYDEVFAASARAKVGVPIGGFMPYFTVGPQYVHSKTRSHGSFLGGMASDSTTWSTTFGLVAAAGAEMLVSSNVSVKAEAGLNLNFPDTSSRYEHTGWSARLGANYYFD